MFNGSSFYNNPGIPVYNVPFQSTPIKPSQVRPPPAQHKPAVKPTPAKPPVTKPNRPSTPVYNKPHCEKKHDTPPTPPPEEGFPNMMGIIMDWVLKIIDIVNKAPDFEEAKMSILALIAVYTKISGMLSQDFYIKLGHDLYTLIMFVFNIFKALTMS